MESSLQPAALSHDLPFSAEGYRPLFELGRGGMARVYLAERVSNGLRKLVVLKILDPALVTSPEMRSAFHREAVLCARLNHPNIVQVFEVHDETTAPMMVMEYVEGITLSQLLSRSDGRLPIRLHVHIIIQALAGLHYFHELRTDDGATFDTEVVIDVAELEPQVTWGTNPGMVAPVGGVVPDPSAITDPDERAAVERALVYMDLEPGVAR